MLEKLVIFSKKSISLPNLVFFVAPQILFWMSILTNISMPGLYYDEAGNDSNVPSIINNSLNNPQMLFPGVGIPLLSSLYQGIPATYSSWLVLSTLGTNIFTIRIAHAIYGSLTLFFFQLLLKSLREKRRLSFFIICLFATDLAYIASFRDQYQNVLTGAPSLFLSLFLINSLKKRNKSKKLLVTAGVALGFSMYCYFPYAMFFVPFSIIVYNMELAKSRLRGFALWMIGVGIGVLPFVLGFISIYLWAGKNWNTFLSTVQGMRAQINPLSSEMNYLEKIRVSINLLESAINNSGNNAMILGLNGDHALIRWNLGSVFFGIALVLSLVLFVNSNSFRTDRFNQLTLSSILIFFFSISFFGSRLGPWHFTPLIPFSYLLIFIILSFFADSKMLRKFFSRQNKSLILGLGIFVALFCLSLNLLQQKSFHENLKFSGGVGMTTSAMFVMQYEAMHEKNETTYFFPEWGFSTSFVLITDNRVRFSYDAKPEAFLRELKLGRDLAILTWNENNAREWAASLESLISKPKVDIISYYTRQRSVAFYKVVATPS